MKVLIDNQEVYVASETLRVENTTSEYAVCSFTVRDFENLNHFYKGQTVEVFNNDGGLEFSGNIFKAKEKNAKKGYLVHNISCQGNSYLAGKRIMIKAFTNTLSGNVVRWILNNYLTEEGITEGRIDDGVEIIEAGFSYVSVLKALTTIAERTDYLLYIDHEKKLHYIDKKANPAPFPATWDSVLPNSVSVDRGNETYRNTQYLLGCKGVTDPKTEVKKGNGEERNFVVGFPISSRPTVEVSYNGGIYEEKTVGVKGLDGEGFDFYFAHNDPIVIQNQEATPLSDVDKIRITYQGLFNIVVKNESRSEIEKQQLKDKGTGLIEAVETASFKGVEASFQYGIQKLARHATEGIKIKYRTDIEGLKPGMIQSAIFPEHDINDIEVLITQVSAEEVSDEFEYEVTAVIGPMDKDWTSFFAKQKSDYDGKIFEGENGGEPIVQPRYDFEKVWVRSEFPNVFGYPLYPNNITYPATDTYPSFSSSDKIKYISWYVNGVEAGRKPVLQVNEDKDMIGSISLLSTDVEGFIEDIAWWGGSQATEELGTGILLDKQPMNIEKTYLEVFQIEKIERKGW